MKNEAKWVKFLGGTLDARDAVCLWEIPCGYATGGAMWSRLLGYGVRRPCDEKGYVGPFLGWVLLVGTVPWDARG